MTKVQRANGGLERSNDSGFTLLELLVSLVIVAFAMLLVPSAIKQAGRAKSTAAALISSGYSEASLAQLSGWIAEATPLLSKNSEGALQVAFSGAAQSMTFVAPIANGPLGAGLYQINISIEPDAIRSLRALVLRIAAHDPDSEVNADRARWLEERTLIANLGNASFLYFGRSSGKTTPDWSQQWNRSDAIPGSVVLNATRANTDKQTVLLSAELKLRNRE
jgi:prepilin-type N-terminal cleavage/methylation domain-containing protein